MIGRFIHQQHIRPADQNARQGDAHLPAAGQRPDIAFDLVILEAEAVQHLARLRFEGVAAEVLVLFLHFAEAGEDAIHVVRLRGVSHGMMQVRKLVMQIAELPAAGDGFVENRPAFHFLHVLTEVADCQLLRNRNLALVRGLLADDHAEQSGLPCTVGTHQADLLTGV